MEGPFASADNRLHSERKIAGGYAILESPAPGAAYRVVERHGIKRSASPHFTLCNESLITMSEEEDEFLEQGHGLYY